MSLVRSPRNFRNRGKDGSNAQGLEDEDQPRAKRRKVFLQTMGQQLREMEAMRIDPSNASQRFPNARSVHFIRSIYDGFNRDQTGQRQSIQTPESDVIPGDEADSLSNVDEFASRYLWTASEVVPASSSTSDAFGFDDLIDWTQSYFDNWHPAFPFLMAPEILQYFERITQHNASALTAEDHYQLIVIRSIVSISLADRRQAKRVSKPIPPRLVFPSFHDAIKCVGLMLADETTLKSLQAVMSVLLFLLSMLRYNAASRLEGLAVRMAFQLGLHRCPYKVDVFSEQEAELRQRVFWSLYCIDRNICPRLGLPLAVQDDDVDVCLPGHEEHKKNSQENGGNYHKLDLLVFLAGQAEFRGSITSLLYGASAKDAPETEHVSRINAELTRWWNEVEDYLELNESEPHQISGFHQMVLLCLKSESIIALNRRAIATTKNSSAYNAALQNCVGAARTIIRTFYAALNKSKDSSTISIPLIWPSFTWAVWMSAFIMIYAANEDQLSCAVAIKHADRSLDILKHLRLRGSMWPDASIVAIREMKEKLGRRNTARDATHRALQRATDQQRTQAMQLLDTPHRSREPSRNRAVAHKVQSSTSIGDGVQTRDFSDSGTFQSSNLSHGAPQSNDLLHVSDTLIGSRQNPSNPQLTGMLHHQWYDFTSDQQFLDLPIPLQDNNDLFYGSDIPFWMGDDQLAGMNGLNST